MTEVRLAPGLQIGEYVLESRLGVGGMGEVWRACQPIIETTVAIKILTFESAARKSQLERFLREARAVNRIQHRNLAKIFSFGELSDGRPYFVMEFLAGDNLRDFLKKSGPLPYATIYHIAEQVCRTLLAAHEVGVIHRDLKPENIFLVTEPGALPFVKVLDFGVAKLSDKDPLAKREHPTLTGATLGTPGYMSPEQYENSKTVDERADIYSMAVIIFEMVCGQHPYEIVGETAYVVIARQLSSDPQKPSSVNPARRIPKALDEFLLRALSRRPEERPRDCKTFLRDLQQALVDVLREKELPTHANEPTQIKASYDDLRAKKVPPMPTPTAQQRLEDVLFSDESRTETRESTHPAIRVDEGRVNTQITPPPISSRPRPDDDVTITGSPAPTPTELEAVEHSEAPDPKKLRPEVMRTTPDVEMPDLIRDLLAQRTSPKDDEEVNTDAPTAAYHVVPVNTPAPISLPTTPKAPPHSTRVLIGAGTSVFLLVLLGWFLFLSPAEPALTSPISGSEPATSKATQPATQMTPATAPSPQTTSIKDPETTPTKEDPRKPDLCKSEREAAKGFMISAKWAQALAVLAKAQEKCPQDPEVQRLFGYTYEQKGDVGFACIRYGTALSFGLSGTAASRTKKSMSELKCQ